MDRFNGTILSFYKICKMRKKKKDIHFMICYMVYLLFWEHFSGINAGYPMWPWPRTSRENFTPRPRSLSPTDTMRQQSGKGFLHIKKKLNQALSVFQKTIYWSMQNTSVSIDLCKTDVYFLSLSEIEKFLYLYINMYLNITGT